MYINTKCLLSIMKIKNRLFLNGEIKINQSIIFDSKHSHYLATVLRSNHGDSISVFNDSAEFIIKLEAIDRRKTVGLVVKKISTVKRVSPLTLFFSPIKRTPTEIIIQKCTEIGVSHFQPIIMEHTQFKTFNIDRLKTIAIEAVEQSNQISIPKISVPIYFEDFLKKNNDSIVACCLIDKIEKMNDVFLSSNSKITGVLIGPEGDFSEREMKLISASKFITPISLGNNVLKSETACIIATALIKEYSNYA